MKTTVPMKREQQQQLTILRLLIPFSQIMESKLNILNFKKEKKAIKSPFEVNDHLFE